MVNALLNADQAITVQEVETEALEILCIIINTLEAVEAYSAVSRIKENRSMSHSYPSDQAVEQFVDDGYRMRRSVEAVACMEFAEREMAGTFKRCKMSMEPHHALMQRADRASKRLYRVLWDLSKSVEDRGILISIADAVGVPSHMRFWEDTPSTWSGRSYTQLRSPLSGMAMFSHCCGFTFIEYMYGKAQERGWSVPLETMEEAIVVAKNSGVVEAKNFIM